MASDIVEVERRLWSIADQLRANSGLKPSEYSRPVLGLLFLRYADGRFADVEKQLKPKPGSRMGAPGPDAFKARGVIYLTPEARFSHLLTLPEGSNLGRALNQAMENIEKHNPDLADALPKNYGAVGDDILHELIKLLAPVEIDGDAFGRVYEYFMGSFAAQEMQKGGEYYTPSSIVDLIVEIIEPYHGRILDPACGSGGMFVHSAEFVRAHKREPGKELSIFGIEIRPYQAGKPRKDKVRKWILSAPTPALLAMAAHGLYTWDVAPDWAATKYDRMRRVLYAKFSQHADLKKLLLDTGAARLVEAGRVANSVNKTWGEVNGKGLNMLDPIALTR